VKTYHPLPSRPNQVKSSQVCNPHNSKSSQHMQPKTVCVRAGRCGAAPPVIQLPDGLIYVLFLSHFSVQLWLLIPFFRMVEATFIPRVDVCVQFLIAPGPQHGTHPVSITHDRCWLSSVSTPRPKVAPQTEPEGRSRCNSALSL
jgi:hypothetical protein